MAGDGGDHLRCGIGKFVDHAVELASFRLYGLPVPGSLTYAIGALEIVGGLLLVGGVLLWVGIARRSVLPALCAVGALVLVVPRAQLDDLAETLLEIETLNELDAYSAAI